MDYFDYAYRDLMFLIRRGRFDLVAELLRIAWPRALLLVGVCCFIIFWALHTGDSRYFAGLIVGLAILPAVAFGVPLLDYLMPIHFGRAVGGELKKVRLDWPDHNGIRRNELTFHFREFGRDVDLVVRYGGKLNVTIGRTYLVLLHPRLERHALVLFDDDARYMSQMLRPLPAERRRDVLERIAELRSWPPNR